MCWLFGCLCPCPGPTRIGAGGTYSVLTLERGWCFRLSSCPSVPPSLALVHQVWQQLEWMSWHVQLPAGWPGTGLLGPSPCPGRSARQLSPSSPWSRFVAD